MYINHIKFYNMKDERYYIMPAIIIKAKVQLKGNRIPGNWEQPIGLLIKTIPLSFPVI